MKKQTIQLIFGLFLIFSAFPVFADFDSQSTGLWSKYSGCTSPVDFNTACSVASCAGEKSSPWVTCPGSVEACENGYGFRKSIYPCSGASQTCPNLSTLNTSTSKCTCNPGTYQNTTTGLISINISCTPNYQTPSNDILAYAVGAGLVTGGLATSFAACATTVAASPVCVAGILAAAAGAGLALSAYNSDGSPVPPPSPDPCAGKNCVSVQLDANKPLTGSGDSVSKDVFGNVKANGSGFTNNGDGTFTKTSTNDDGSTTTTFVDELNDRITSTTTTNTGSYSSALQFGLDSNGFPTVSQVSQWTDTAGTTTYQQQGAYDQNGVISSQSQASQGTGGYGGTTGGNTGGGGQTGGGGADSNAVDAGITDCEEYGCAKESTQLKVLDSLKGGGEIDHVQISQDALDGALNGLDDIMDDNKKAVSDKFNEILNDTAIKDLFDQLGDFNPLNFDSAECSLQSNFMGHELNLSYCDEQSTIHWILSFVFFVWFSFAIINTLLEKNR